MSFIGAALIIGGAGAAASLGGAAISASSNGGAPGIEDNYVAGPNAGIEQTNANQWATQLTQDQADPTGNFGGISPDWNDIWNQTQQQVQNYFSGTATTPGVNDQINASFAQRGMAGDPAASFLQSASGANEAQDLGNLSAQENIAKQTFAQTAKQNWYTNMNNFQGAINPTAGSWTGAQPYATPGQQIGNAISAAGTGAVGLASNAISNQSQLDYLNSILNPTSAASYASPTGFSGITMDAGLPAV